LIERFQGACWHEDHLHPIRREDQGETVPAGERTELRFNRKLSLT
jgi:hypothetical protein